MSEELLDYPPDFFCLKNVFLEENQSVGHLTD